MSTEPVVYQLRRPTSDKSWGFALQGGADQGLPVFVHKITRNGIAHRAGLEPGDVIVKICKTPLTGMSHSQVKAELLRAGSDLDFTVLKLVNFTILSNFNNFELLPCKKCQSKA
ncbi:unnamed protein product [Rodentolepis nana]|uniref:PDZ domain-containing protein n=1 Tax=Rodentolepis nana TaxID=102285 RepID=A0A0R3TNJ8_RODNA|nr:unnamed protein product [Rodentolepis nana]